MLVRNGSIVLIMDTEPADRPERLRVFHTDSGGGGVQLDADVGLRYETVSAGGADPFSACACPAEYELFRPTQPVWGALVRSSTCAAVLLAENAARRGESQAVACAL